MLAGVPHLITTCRSITQVIGMHFMNPVPVMKLVEIIPGLATSPAVLTETKALATAMGKVCTTSQDVPGFVANRLLMPYINEAVLTLESVSSHCTFSFIYMH